MDIIQNNADFTLKTKPPDPPSGRTTTSSFLSVSIQSFKMLFTADPEKKKIALWPIICMGISTAWSGHFFYWSNGLQAGFWLFLISFLFVSSGMFALTLCLAEINSCLPFSGGSYGFSRITSTAFIAFITGVCDRINLLAGFIQGIYIISTLLIRIFDINIYYEILFWSIISTIGAVAYVRLFPKRSLWLCFTSVIWAIFFFYIIVIACLISKTNKISGENLPSNYDRTATSPSSALYHTFTDCIPLMFFFYHGMETIPFTALHIYEARKNLPKALLSTFSFLFCSAIILICLMSAIPAIYHNYAPNTSYSYSSSMESSPVASIFIFSPILTEVLHIPQYAVNILYILPVIGSCYGFFYASGRLLYAMTESHLYLISVVRLLQVVETKRLVLWVTIITALLAMIGLSWAIYDIFWIMYALSYYTFIISQLCNLSSFIAFRKKYSSLHREFTSPLGIPGAIYALFVLLVMLVAMLMRVQNRAIVLPMLFALLIMWYFVYRKVQHHQIFSKEEETILFLAHVMKANMARKNRYLSRQSIKQTNAENSIRSSASSQRTSVHRPTIRATNTLRSTDNNSDLSPNYNNHDKSFHSNQSSYQSPPTVTDYHLRPLSGSESSKDEHFIASNNRSMKAMSTDSHNSSSRPSNNLKNSLLVREAIPEEDGLVRENSDSLHYQGALTATERDLFATEEGISPIKSMNSARERLESHEEAEEEEQEEQGEHHHNRRHDHSHHYDSSMMMTPLVRRNALQDDNDNDDHHEDNNDDRNNHSNNHNNDEEEEEEEENNYPVNNNLIPEMPNIPSSSSLAFSDRSSKSKLFPEKSRHFFDQEMFTKAASLVDEGEIFNTILDQSELLQTSGRGGELDEELAEGSGGGGGGGRGNLSLFDRFLSRSRSSDPDEALINEHRLKHKNRNNSLSNNSNNNSNANSSTSVRPSPVSPPLLQKKASTKRNLLKESYLLLRASIANSSKVLPTNNSYSSHSGHSQKSNNSSKSGGDQTANNQSLHLSETATDLNQSTTDLMTMNNVNDSDGDEEEGAGVISKMNSGKGNNNDGASGIGSGFMRFASTSRGNIQFPSLSPNNSLMQRKTSNDGDSNHPSRASSASLFPRPNYHPTPTPAGVMNFSYVFDRIANSSSFDEVQYDGTGQLGPNPSVDLPENEYIKLISDKFAAKRVVLDNYILKQKSYSRDSYQPSIAGSMETMNNHNVTSSNHHHSASNNSRSHQRPHNSGNIINAPPNSVNNSLDMRTPMAFSHHNQSQSHGLSLASNSMTIQKKPSEEKFLTPEANTRNSPTSVLSPVGPTPFFKKASSSSDSEERKRLKQSPPADAFFLPEGDNEEEEEAEEETERNNHKNDSMNDNTNKAAPDNKSNESNRRRSRSDNNVYPITNTD